MQRDHAPPPSSITNAELRPNQACMTRCVPSLRPNDAAAVCPLSSAVALGRLSWIAPYQTKHTPTLRISCPAVPLVIVSVTAPDPCTVTVQECHWRLLGCEAYLPLVFSPSMTMLSHPIPLCHRQGMHNALFAA